MRQEGEPSVEEILDSIKRVIERDAQDAVQARVRTSDDSSSDAEPASAIPLAQDDSDDILDLSEAGAPLDEVDEPLGADDSAETLTNDAAADAMRQSLAALAMLSDPPAKPQIVRSGETSLEGMVREMLRPMLAQWLDANLPEMVERLVKAEIARIAGKKR